MAVQKTDNYSFNKPDRGTSNWDTLINDNTEKMDLKFKQQSDSNVAMQADIQELKDADVGLKNRIDNIVTQSGSSNTEIVDARTSLIDGAVKPNLKARMDLAENYAKDMEILLWMGV